MEVNKRIVWTAIRNCTMESLAEYKSGSFIKSPVFQVELEGNTTEWLLIIYPNGYESNNKISLFLERQDYSSMRFIVEYKLIIGNVYKMSSASSEEFHKRGYGNSEFLSHEKFAECQDEFIEDNKLKVICEMELSSKSKVGVETTFIKDVYKMLHYDQFTDFMLKCSDDKVLNCHKFILAARSPVFHAMLSNNMKEAQEGFAEVPDFNSEVMKKVLRFIYCKKNENLGKLSHQLIYAAEKYQLIELKQICIESIVKNLTTDNVIESLIISSRVSGPEKMFTQCADFVMNNYNAVTKGLKDVPNDVLKKLMDHIIDRNKTTENI